MFLVILVTRVCDLQIDNQLFLRPLLDMQSLINNGHYSHLGGICATPRALIPDLHLPDLSLKALTRLACKKMLLLLLR